MSTESEKIAVIGMACRFPGAKNLEEYWQNLVSGKETISHFSFDEVKVNEPNFVELKKDSNYVRARGVLNDVDKFDASFFGYTPHDASLTDPQHRVWLETVWDGFENAGCNPFAYKGAIGVFAGSFINTYLLNNVLQNKEQFDNYVRLRTTESFQLLTANDAGFMPTKTAYNFNLKGPAINVQTACSTSLVAISQACQSLYTYESDICIAGGVSILTPQKTGYIYQEGAIPSPDGHCRPFDKDGKGTVMSNGVGVVILKRLEDALQDNDHIHAVIDGWGINNDGSNKVSYMAPSVDGQAEAIVMAQSLAGVNPENIAYIEAHGTGTPLGDPIEVAALTKAFNLNTNKKQFCGIGSVKSNIGHTDAAAGIASFIKVCLSAYHKKIPATLNFKSPNPHINFGDSPFYVVDKLIEWNTSQKLIMGVSSFGIGGTNSHILVEEPPKKEEVRLNNENALIIPLSAKTPEALEQRKKDFIYFIQHNQNLPISDIAHTLWKGRNHMKYRSTAIANSINELLNDQALFVDGQAAGKINSIAFIFPGQGAQYVNMGRHFYNNNELFKDLVDKGCNQYFLETNQNLKELIFNSTDEEIADNILNQTQITQPALFIIEYSLAKVLIHNNIIPNYFLGHSIGEFAGACLSGVFDYETGLKIVTKRAQLMQQMPIGKMYAVKCSKKKLNRISNSLFEIAAENAPESCTISFELEKTDAIKTLFELHEIQYIPLNTSHAFHSKAFEPIIEEFSKYISQFQLNAPKIPVISCLTGILLSEEQAKSGEYWAQQLRNTVLFNKGISTIVETENVLFVEIGPNTHLSSILRCRTELSKKVKLIYTLGGPTNKENFILERTISSIWMNSNNFLPPTNFVGGNGGRKIVLPGYPFERKRYWIEKQQGNFRNDFVTKVQEEGLKDTEIPNLNHCEIPITHQIKSIISELSGYPINKLESKISFDDMGLDSLFLAQFARKLEIHFKLKINFRQLDVDYRNIQALSEHILKKVNSPSDQSQKNSPDLTFTASQDNFIHIQPRGTKTTIILVHGEVLNKVLPKFLGEDQPFHGFLHLGSDGEKVPYNDLKVMAKAYLDQLLKQVPEGPYILGGYSIGGVLAFEMAIMLKEMGYEIPKLILLDCKNPAIKESFDWEQGIYKTMRNRIIKPIYYYLIKLTMVSTISKLCFMLNIPIPVKRRRNYIFSIYFYMLKKYNYTQSTFEGEVILFKASENDSSLNHLGWDKLIPNLKLITVQGNHASFLHEMEENKLIKDKLKDFLNA